MQASDMTMPALLYVIIYATRTSAQGLGLAREVHPESRETIVIRTGGQGLGFEPELILVQLLRTMIALKMPWLESAPRKMPDP